MNSPMKYTEFHPVSDLKPWLAAHWHFQVDESVSEVDHWIPPNGGVMLTIVKDRPAILSGPRTEPFPIKVYGGTKIWGSMFWPGAATSLLSVDVETLTGTTMPVEIVVNQLRSSDVDQCTVALSQWVEDLKMLAGLVNSPEEILDGLNKAIAGLLPAANPLDEKVMHAVFQIMHSNGDITVNKIAQQSGLSTRQLRRRFRRATGLSPKDLVRIQRLRRSAVDAVMQNELSWISLAAARGYSDQAHLIREFQELMGISPGSFKKHFQGIEHGNLIR